VHTILNEEIIVLDEFHARGEFDTIKATITMNIGLGDGEPEDSYAIVSTLAHEMLHAFLFRFICKESSLRCSHSCNWIYLMGGGHGPLWANAMVSIRTKLGKLWCGPETACGVPLGVMCDMYRSSWGWQPTKEQLVRWGLWGRTAMHQTFFEEVSFLRHEWPWPDGDPHPRPDPEKSAIINDDIDGPAARYNVDRSEDDASDDDRHNRHHRGHKHHSHPRQDRRRRDTESDTNSNSHGEEPEMVVGCCSDM
jgi:hypothetical protein